MQSSFQSQLTTQEKMHEREIKRSTDMWQKQTNDSAQRQKETEERARGTQEQLSSLQSQLAELPMNVRL